MIEQHHQISTPERAQALADMRESQHTIARAVAFGLHQQHVITLWLTRDPVTHVVFPNAVDRDARAVMQFFFSAPKSPAEYLAVFDRYACIAASGQAWAASHLGGHRTPTREAILAKIPPAEVRDWCPSVCLYLEIDEAPEAELGFAHNREDGTLWPWFYAPTPVRRPAPQSMIGRGIWSKMPDELLRQMASRIIRSTDLISADHLPPAESPS